MQQFNQQRQGRQNVGDQEAQRFQQYYGQQQPQQQGQQSNQNSDAALLAALDKILKM
jgi:hypothetical protein